MLARFQERIDSWLFVPDEDGAQPRSRLVGYLLLGSMGALVALFLFNIADWLLGATSVLDTFLFEDAVACAFMLAAWALYRRGRVRLAGYAYIALSLALTVMLDLPVLDRAMLLYAVPVAAASFLIAPAASMVTAALATIAYFAVFVRTSGLSFTYDFNYLSLLALWLLAAVSWLVSERSDRHLAQRDRAVTHLTLEEARLASLYDIARYQARDAADLLDHALTEAIRLTGSKFGYIYFYDEATRKFTLNTWSSDVMANCAITDKQTVYDLDQTGVWGEAVRQRQPLLLNDFQTPNALRKGYPAGHVAISRFLTIPIFHNDAIVAVVGVANKETDYDADDQRQLSLLMDAVWADLERERAGQALRESEARYRLLAEHMTDVIWRLDLATFRFTYVSPSVQQLRGYSAQEVMAQPAEASLTPESQAILRQMLDAMLPIPPRELQVPGGSVRVELAQPRRDGSIVWTEVAASPLFDARGRPAEILGVSRDISDRKAARDLVLASEERYRTLFATILEGFALHEIICDPPGHPVDYRFLDVNPAFERLTGLARHELIGKTVLEVLPTTEDYWIQTYGRVALTGEPVSFENYTQSLDRHYAVSAFSPRAGQFATVFTDVTDARRARLALEASLAEKELLLREIHHRVKNNLQVIASLLNLQMGGRTDPVLVQTMRDSQNRIRSMALIHTKLYESRDLSNVDFGGFVRDLTHILSQSFGAASRGITFRVDAGTIPLGVDTVIPCSLIINELVTNSMRHAFRPGQPGLITISMQADAGDYILRVADDGPGLPSELDIRETRSLGLRLVTMLTEQLNGSVSVEPGHGACFVVRFPHRETGAVQQHPAVPRRDLP